MSNQNPRRTKLIQPRLQIRMVACFVGLAGLGMLLQFLLMSYRLTTAAAHLGNSNGEIVDQVPGLLLETLAFSMGIVLPIIFGFGVLLTFKVAGPVYRFEQFLKSVIRGEQLGPCKLRDGDELQGLCNLVNEATEPLRRGKVAPSADVAPKGTENDSDAPPQVA